MGDVLIAINVTYIIKITLPALRPELMGSTKHALLPKNTNTWNKKMFLIYDVLIPRTRKEISNVAPSCI